jgi:hypothetical protein
MVARERFELSSAGPEPAMLDRYTTGLQTIKICLLLINLIGFSDRKSLLFLSLVDLEGGIERFIY